MLSCKANVPCPRAPASFRVHLSRACTAPRTCLLPGTRGDIAAGSRPSLPHREPGNPTRDTNAVDRRLSERISRREYVGGLGVIARLNKGLVISQQETSPVAVFGR